VFLQSMGMRLRAAYLTFHRRANAHFEPFGITADQFVLLTILTDEPGLTQSEIVIRAASDPNTIGQMLLRLEHRKLIRREPHPADSRAKRVFLTSQGRKMQSRLIVSWQDPLNEIDACFHPKELDLLKRLLARIPDAAEQHLAPKQEEVA
jgi:DNA-binding MarR family transcriptional regulator